jgi:hypothetical protein
MMKYFLLGNEESVAEIAGRAFRNLPADRRAEVEAMILKANPQLGSGRKPRPGTLINIPDSAKSPATDKRDVIDPIEDLKRNVIRQLKALEAEVRRSHTRHRKHQKESAQLLHSARRDLQEHPQGEKIGGKLKKHFTVSEKSNNESKDIGLKALRNLRKTAGLLRG